MLTSWTLVHVSFCALMEADLDGSHVEQEVTSHLLKESVSQDCTHSSSVGDTAHWMHIKAKQVGLGELSSHLPHPGTKLDIGENLVLKEEKVYSAQCGCGMKELLYELWFVTFHSR